MRRRNLLATAGAAMAALCGAGVRHRLVVVSIVGDSMRPAFSSGDRVLVVRRRPDRLRVGDVIVFAPPRAEGGSARRRAAAGPDGSTGLLVKRVAAMPGDVVPDAVRARVPGAVVGRGRLVVLGDNPAVSFDSRQAGAVAFDQVVGRVARRLTAAVPDTARRPRPLLRRPVHRPAHHKRPVDRPAHNKGDQR